MASSSLNRTWPASTATAVPDPATVALTGDAQASGAGSESAALDPATVALTGDAQASGAGSESAASSLQTSLRMYAQNSWYRRSHSANPTGTAERRYIGKQRDAATDIPSKIASSRRANHSGMPSSVS